MTPRPIDPTDPESTLLARYLSGECSRAERLLIEGRIAGDPEFAATVERLRAAWTGGGGAAREAYDPSRLWERVAADTVNAPSSVAPVSRPHLVRPMRRSATNVALPIAAAVVLAVGSLSTWLVVGRSDKPAASVPSEQKTIATRRAQRADIYLSDGTHVKLGPASTLRFASVFGRTRDVHLEGEAYFDVAHDSTRPFAVHTSRGIARDIGTKFSVRAYANDRTKDVEVVVEEGIVALDTVLLHANDVGRITETGTIETQRDVDVKARLAWLEGRLTFKNTPLRDALPVLARWYDEDLRVTDSALLDYPITLTLTTERFTDAVDVLAHALNAHVAHRGNEYVLFRRNR